MVTEADHEPNHPSADYQQLHKFLAEQLGTSNGHINLPPILGATHQPHPLLPKPTAANDDEKLFMDLSFSHHAALLRAMALYPEHINADWIRNHNKGYIGSNWLRYRDNDLCKALDQVDQSKHHPQGTLFGRLQVYYATHVHGQSAAWAT